MNDKQFANLAARAAMAGIEITRRGPASFNLVRGGESQYWFKLPGATSFTRTAGCQRLAKEIEDILRDELWDVGMTAGRRWFKTNVHIPRRGLTIF